MDKYYTPEIEDFYVGFEFEENQIDSNWKSYGWEKKVVTVDFNFKSTSEYIGLCRVKYLDKSDIESLGWKLKTDLYVKDNLTLQVHKDSITIKYYDNFNNELRTKVEQINIKNKSELIKLLKQLGIG